MCLLLNISLNLHVIIRTTNDITFSAACWTTWIAAIFYETYESSRISVKSAMKAKDRLHKACQRASETRERTLHRPLENAQLHARESHETVIDF